MDTLEQAVARAEAAEAALEAEKARTKALVEAAKAVRSAKSALSSVRWMHDPAAIPPRVDNLTAADNDLFAALDEIEHAAVQPTDRTEP